MKAGEEDQRTQSVSDGPSRASEMETRKGPRAYAWGFVLLPFLASRVWCALWVYVGAQHQDLLGADVWRGVGNAWLRPWTGYDSQWFLKIAQHGYEPSSTPFFPLYPLLLRIAGPDTVRMAAWGVIASHVAFLLSLGVFERLTRLDYNAATARRAVWLLAFFPTAAVFGAVYTESLFLLLLLLTFWAVRRDNWIGAGFCGSLAALTRNSGPLICLALGCEAWRRFSRRDTKEVLPAPPNIWARLASDKRVVAICVLLPLLAFGAFQWGLARHFGNLLVGVKTHQQFGRHFGFPLRPLWDEARDILSGRGLEITTLLNLAAVIGAFVMVFLQRHTMRASYAVLLCGILLMQLIYGRTTAPFTNSSLRFLSTTFPFVQLLAVYAAPLTSNRLRLVLSFVIYASICALFAYGWGTRQFVMG